MKLIGFRDGSIDMIGVAIDDNSVAPLTSIDEFYSDTPRWRARAGEVSGESVPRTQLSLCPPVPRTAKVLCLGHNYASHAEETHRELPPYPAVFARYASTLVCDGDDVPVPASEPGLDWEVELAAIVGEPIYVADEEQALRAVLGYTVLNDISARTHQLHTSQWTVGKNAARSAPIGPVVVTADSIDVCNLQLETRFKGVVVQQGSTADLIFSVGFTLAYLSETISLLPGDVLSTGTPGGVGFRRQPPVLMQPGDVVEVAISEIGVLRNRMIAA